MFLTRAPSKVALSAAQADQALEARHTPANRDHILQTVLATCSMTPHPVVYKLACEDRPCWLILLKPEPIVVVPPMGSDRQRPPSLRPSGSRWWTRTPASYSARRTAIPPAVGRAGRRLNRRQRAVPSEARPRPRPAGGRAAWSCPSACSPRPRTTREPRPPPSSRRAPSSARRCSTPTARLNSEARGRHPGGEPPAQPTWPARETGRAAASLRQLSTRPTAVSSRKATKLAKNGLTLGPVTHSRQRSSVYGCSRARLEPNEAGSPSSARSRRSRTSSASSAPT